MAEFAVRLKDYADLLKSLGYFLPILWACFVTAEWWSQSGYYKRFHIEHSFKPNYKLVFNPSYILSLLFATFMWLTILLLQWVVGLQMRFFFLPLFVTPYCILTKEHSTESIDLEDIEKSNVESVDRYREKYKTWKKLDNTRQTLILVWVNWLVGCIFSLRLSCFISDSLINELYRKISKSLCNVDDLRRILYILWFVMVCVWVHCLFNDFSGKARSRYDKIEYFRIIEYQKKMYAIIAPNEIDNNGVCVAVRSIICRKENGLIYGILFSDKALTMNVPYEGESILVNVDIMYRIVPREMMFELNAEKRIRKMLEDDGLVEILDNNEWNKLDKYEQPIF